MEPTLTRGALAIVRQCAIGDYRRGDIVIATIKGGSDDETIRWAEEGCHHADRRQSSA